MIGLSSIVKLSTCLGQHRTERPRTHVRGHGRDAQRRSLDVLEPKKLGERADKCKELHADAHLGKTMDALENASRFIGEIP